MYITDNKKKKKHFNKILSFMMSHRGFCFFTVIYMAIRIFYLQKNIHFDSIFQENVFFYHFQFLTIYSHLTNYQVYHSIFFIFLCKNYKHVYSALYKYSR